MTSNTSKWILYNLVVCFAVYWLSNLILWYPWSMNETFGQILMLTINPLLWGFASYACIIKYLGTNTLKGVVINSLLFISEAIISDLIFFVGIRQATDKLMRPTTYYGWGFVASVPFIIYLIFRKRIENNKLLISRSNFTKPLTIGMISFVVIAIILIFNIRFN